jgi:hypothetical protein
MNKDDILEILSDTYNSVFKLDDAIRECKQLNNTSDMLDNVDQLIDTLRYMICEIESQ